jgi:hypothetical protein
MALSTLELGRERARPLLRERARVAHLGAATLEHRADRGIVRGLEVIVDEADVADAAAEQTVDDGGHVLRQHRSRDRNRAGESGRAFGNAVADGGCDHADHRAAFLEQLARAQARGRRDDDVGAEPEVRAVRFGRADRYERDHAALSGDQGLERRGGMSGQELLGHELGNSPRFSRSINVFLSTLPRSFFGRSSTNTTQRGYLCFESLP